MASLAHTMTLEGPEHDKVCVYHEADDESRKQRQQPQQSGAQAYMEGSGFMVAKLPVVLPEARARDKSISPAGIGDALASSPPFLPPPSHMHTHLRRHTRRYTRTPTRPQGVVTSLALVLHISLPARISLPCTLPADQDCCATQGGVQRTPTACLASGATTSLRSGPSQ